MQTFSALSRQISLLTLLGLGLLTACDLTSSPLPAPSITDTVGAKAPKPNPRDTTRVPVPPRDTTRHNPPIPTGPPRDTTRHNPPTPKDTTHLPPMPHPPRDTTRTDTTRHHGH